MQSLSRSSTIVRVVSALPRWWLPLRDAAVLMAPVSAHPNKRLDHVPRAKDQTWARLCFSSGSTQAMDEAETKEEAADDEDAEVYEEPIIRGSSHRDGAIYSNETRATHAMQTAQGSPRRRRCGDRGGAVDMSFASVDPAVHAIVDVVVSDVQVAGFELSLGSVLSFEEIQGGILLEEFQLFRGTVVGDEPCALRRFVVAVRWDTVMQLKFKIATTSKGCSGNDVEHSCSFEAQLKGEASHQINLEIASILVKVTWATLSL